MSGLDEVTLAVDLEQPRCLAVHLAADDEIGRRVDVVLRHVRAVARAHLAQRVAEQPRDFEHRARGPDVLRVVTRACLLLEDVDRVLRHREVSG